MTVKVCVPDVPPDVVIETLRVPFAAPDTIENVTVNSESLTDCTGIVNAPAPSEAVEFRAERSQTRWRFRN